MLGACVNLQTGHGGSADGILGEHALNGQLHSELGLLSHQSCVLYFLQVADPAGVVLIQLLLQLLAGELSLGSVDNDNEIAAVNVGGKGGLVLAADGPRVRCCLLTFDENRLQCN